MTDHLRAPSVGQSRRSGFLGIGTVLGAGTWFLPSAEIALAARTGLTGSAQRTGRACTVGTGFSALRQCVLGVTLRRGTLSLQKALGACGGLRRLSTRVTTGSPKGVVGTLGEVVVQVGAVLEEAVGGVNTRGATVLRTQRRWAKQGSWKKEVRPCPGGQEQPLRARSWSLPVRRRGRGHGLCFHSSPCSLAGGQGGDSGGGCR